MTTRIELIQETEKARKYRFGDGSTIWIPKSVCRSTLKFPPSTPLGPEIHEVEIEDWWWDKYMEDEDEP